MMSGSRFSAIPGLALPPVLIFYHIPKTGGVTMQAIVRHCFSPDEHFDPDLSGHDTALWARSTARMAEKFRNLPIERRRAVRCVVGEHIAMDVAGIFDRPSKFFTIVREPIDRVVSNFHYGRTRPELPSYPYIKDVTLEEYLESGMGLDYDNHQVRLLSGCPELDSQWRFKNGRVHVSAPPVKRSHLEMAKRNIEEHFIVAAPLEKFTHLVWYLKLLYGWPGYRLVFRVHNRTPKRPMVQDLSETTRKRVETLNQYDIELYEWVKNRFLSQIEPLEPNFSRDVRRFELLNCSFRFVRRFTPQPIHAAMKHLLLPQTAMVR